MNHVAVFYGKMLGMNNENETADTELDFDPFADLTDSTGAVMFVDGPETTAVIALNMNPHDVEIEIQEGEDLLVEVETQLQSAKTITTTGSVFVYDLETVPDESRFPRPIKQEKVKRLDLAGVSLAKLITETVQVIQAKIPKLSEEQLLSLQETETNSKKPRKGVLDAIAKQIEIDNADDHEIAMMEWRKLATSPLCCKIVSLSIESRTYTNTMIAKTPDEERELLRVLWHCISNYETRCGYNITAFDDACLVFRSMLLGVDATKKITRKKYGSRESIDLMQVMFPSSFSGGGKKKDKSEEEDWAGPETYKGINGNSQKLKDVLRMLGIVPLAGYEMDGGQVFDLVEAGKWDEVARYVHSDGVAEFELYKRLSEYMVMQ